MFEIVVVLVFVMVVFLVFVLLPILLVVKAVRLLFGPAVKELRSAVQESQQYKWKHADAAARERMVRVKGSWRIIARVVGAGCCAAGVVLTFPTPVVVIFGLGAYRLLKPIRQEMRDACAYRSTGAKDEPPYSSRNISDL
jgi:hypothetical protein